MRLNTAAPLALGAALALVSSSRVAHADPPPEVRAAATALFDDARRAMQARDYASACPKLEEAQRMDPGIGILFNLADCYEHVGRTASAWSSFREVAAEAATKGQADREKTARARAAALEPKLMRLRVVVPPEANANGLEVTRDGASIAAAIWGTPVPADPGKHAIVAKAPGKEPWRSEITLQQAGAVVDVVVAPLADAKAPSPSAAPPSATPAPASAATGDAAPQPGSWQRPLAVAVAGAGVVGLGVGTAFGFLAKSSYDQSNQNAGCDKNGFCSADAKALHDSAVTKGTIGTVVFVGGAAFVAGGVILWLTAPKAPAQVGLTPRGPVVRGSF